MKVCPNPLALGSIIPALCPISDSLCCTALHRDPQTAPRLLLPFSERFVESAQSHYAVNAPVLPSCILQPQSTEEVAQAVSILTRVDDGSQQCQFAVRSGGHTPWAGAASSPDGVTIDLSLMNSTVYHSENTTASIDAGARWGSVYKALRPYGVAVTGGRSDSVGVGGLTTGGGLSFFAAQYGFVCDNVQSFEVVLANGTAVTATSTAHTRLFRVLKGGSNNVGIVTKISITAFPQGDLWGGIIAHDVSSTPLQISALVNFTERLADDPYASMVSIWHYSSTEREFTAASGVQYARPIPDPPIFHELCSIGSASTVRYADIHDLMMETAPPPGQRALFLTLTFGNDARVVEKTIDVQKNMIQEARNQADGRLWSIIGFAQPFPTLYGQLSRKNGGNILGVERMEKNSLLYLLYLAWDDEADDQLFHELGYSAIEHIKHFAQSVDADHDFIYLNYAGKHQDPLRSYGKENVVEILEVAKTYDPQGVFQTQVPGGFKAHAAYG